MSSRSFQSIPLRLGIRIIVACLLSLGLCKLLGLEQSYPAELTAIIVTQASVGASLKAMGDRFLGSLGGAVWGIIVLFTLNSLHLSSEVLTLTAALVPLAFLAAFKPSYRAAPVTAIILLFTAGNTSGILESAMHRMVAIGIGSVVALGVSLFVLPARAHATLLDSVADVLWKLEALTKALWMASQTEAEVLRLHDELRTALNRTEAVASEAIQEREAHLTTLPDPVPVCRVLRRLRNDLIMIGRMKVHPFPDVIETVLHTASVEVGQAIAAFFRSSGDAIGNQQPAPPLDEFEGRLATYTSAVNELRRLGITRNLPDETIARVFGLTFAMEQLHVDLQDLSDRAKELSAFTKRR